MFRWPSLVLCSQFVQRVRGETGEVRGEVKRVKQLQKVNAFLDHIMGETVFDLKEVLKIARSEKFRLSMKELLEAITVKLRDRYRLCFVLSPMTQYFLES